MGKAANSGLGGSLSVPQGASVTWQANRSRMVSAAAPGRHNEEVGPEHPRATCTHRCIGLAEVALQLCSHLCSQRSPRARVYLTQVCAHTQAQTC